jgi:AcrR family transcriptional regulator
VFRFHEVSPPIHYWVNSGGHLISSAGSGQMNASSAIRSDARANRARLVAAARDLFRERGLGVDVKDIAERANVGIGTVYRNFASKDELLSAVVDEMAEDVERALRTFEHEPDPGRRLERMVIAALDFAGAEGELLGKLRGLKQDGPPPAVVAIVLNRLDEARRAGAVRDLPPAILFAYLHLHFDFYLRLRDEMSHADARDMAFSLFAAAVGLRAAHAETAR